MTKNNHKQQITGWLIVALGVFLLRWGIQDWLDGYQIVWLLPFPPQILWGLANIAGGYYVLKGGNWRDLYIHF
jgi:hypothetical protein